MRTLPFFPLATSSRMSKIRETLAAYRKLKELSKRVVGPVDLIDDNVLSENLADAMKLIGDFL